MQRVVHGHQVGRILGISNLQGDNHGNGDSGNRYRCRRSLVFLWKGWTERIKPILINDSISRCSCDVVLAGASASSFEYCNRDSMLLRPTLDIFECLISSLAVSSEARSKGINHQRFSHFKNQWKNQ